MSHYEFTDETREYAGRTLHRIRATRDLPEHGVKAGDLGGWVERESNLHGDAWVADNAVVAGKAIASGNAKISGCSIVGDAAWVDDNATVLGHALVTGNARIFEDAVVSGDACVEDNVVVSGHANISGITVLRGNERASGNARVKHPREHLHLSHIGSEARDAHLWRTKDGNGLRVGCWTGTIETLMDEVDRRAAHWEGPEQDKQAWRAQYAALKALCEATMLTWKERETK